MLEEEKYIKSIFDAICRDYDFVYLCDLQADSVVQLKLYKNKKDSTAESQNEKKDSTELSSSYSDRIRFYYDNYVVKETCPDFLEKLDASYLMEYLPRHDGQLIYRYQVNPNSSKCEHIEIHIIKLDDADAFKVVMCFRMIDRLVLEEKRQKQQLQDINARLEEQIKTIGGLSNAYFAVYWVDLLSNTCKAVKDIPYFAQAVQYCRTADDVEAAFMSLCVMPEDKEKMSKFMNWRRLERVFEKDNVIVEEFHGAFMPWEWCRASWIVADRNEMGTATSALFAVEDISGNVAERKQWEQEHKLLEVQNQVIAGLSKEYTTVWFVTEEGKSCVKYQDTGKDSVARESVFLAEKVLNYTDGMRDYGNYYVCEEDREEFFHKIQYEVVLQEIRKHSIYSVIYRRQYRGKREYFQLSFTLADNSGKSSDFVAGFKNVDTVVLAERQKNEALSQALTEAEHASRAKTQFLNNMSHDIRTPMNALLGYTRLMKKELTDPKLLHYQEKIEQSGSLLLSIINNVLDMARIESGKMELDENYAEVQEILHEIGGVFEVEAEKKGIHLIYEIQVTHIHILCDVTKVKEILINLVSNAVKYTPSGGTVVLRSLEIPCSKDGFMCIKTEVIDTGIGMSTDYLPTLFDSFTRERNTTAGKIAGTGLGMSIVKRLVEMMGGSIEVESELGKGTKFTVILQHRMADEIYYEHKKDKNLTYGAKEDIQGKHILLAEDNDLNAEIAITILEEMGLLVDRVEDGIQCVARVEHAPAEMYDLILMDIQMPNMDGYKTTHAIRQFPDKKKADIPIIAMTANAFEEDRKRALLAGMNGHIAKPIDVKKLEEVMLSVL